MAPIAGAFSFMDPNTFLFLVCKWVLLTALIKVHCIIIGSQFRIVIFKR